MLKQLPIIVFRWPSTGSPCGSLRVAACATVPAVLAGVGLGYVLVVRRFRGREVLDDAVTLPLLLPPSVLAYYLLVLLARDSALGRLYERIAGVPLLFTWQAAVLAALLYSVPLMTRSAQSAFAGIEPACLKSARTLGAREWRVFARLALPLAARPLAAASILVFARCLGEFGITLMIAGNLPGQTQTLPLAVYEAVGKGQGQTALLLALAVSALALLCLVAAGRVSRVRFGLLK